MELIIGCLGKPSAGKSSFLNAATDAKAKIGNYPFTTIEPNVGVSFVRRPCACKRFGRQAECRPKYGACKEGMREVPIKILDVAGLVPGASEGLGLGNKFLDDLCGAHVLLHILDCSGTTNEKGEVTSGYNPINDAEWLNQEIHEWIFRNLWKRWDTVARRHAAKKQGVARTLQPLVGGYGAKMVVLHEVLQLMGVVDPVDLTTWDEAVVRSFVRHFVEVRFRMVLVLNKIDKKEAHKHLPKFLEKYDESKVVLCSAASEIALRQLARKGHIVYDGHSRLEEGPNPMNEKQRLIFENTRDLIVERFGSTGVQEAISRAVDQARVCVVYPVKSIHSLMGSEGILSDAMIVRCGTTVGELASMISGAELEFVECAQTGQRIGEDTILTDENNVVRFNFRDIVSKKDKIGE